jgi:hypothetical protein
VFEVFRLHQIQDFQPAFLANNALAALGKAKTSFMTCSTEVFFSNETHRMYQKTMTNDQ